jgi:uncharacterized integral membrane protein
MPANIRKIVGWSLVGLLALFILINFSMVEINFFFLIRVRLPLALILFLSAAMGAGAVLALNYIKDLRKDKPPPQS